MDIPSVFFYLIFAIPMAILFVWILRQDKKQRKLGYFIFFLILVFAIYVILTKAPSYQEIMNSIE